MDLIGINTDLTKTSTNAYIVKIEDNKVFINDENVNINVITNNNISTLVSDFIKKDTSFMKFTINIDNNTNMLLEKSYIIRGDIIKNSYVETSRELLIELVYYNILKENFKHLFGNDVLFYRFILNVSFLKLKDILALPVKDSCIYKDCTKHHSMYIDDLNTLHQSLMKSIFLKVFVVHKKEDAQIVITYGEKNVEYLNNQILITIDEDFYQGGIDTINSLDNLELLLLEHKFKDIKIELPKIEKKEGCCGGGCDKGSCEKGSCCQDKSKEEKEEKKEGNGCCKNKPDAECCKKNTEVKCDKDSCADYENCCGAKEQSKTLDVLLRDVFDNKEELGYTLFLKGSKEEPKCKYSKPAVAKLNSIELDYQGYNILDNEELRQKLKDVHPTYPQLYYNYNFVCGGDDINDKSHDELTAFLNK